LDQAKQNSEVNGIPASVFSDQKSDFGAGDDSVYIYIYIIMFQNDISLQQSTIPPRLREDDKS